MQPLKISIHRTLNIMEQEELKYLDTCCTDVVCHWYKGLEPHSKLIHTSHGDEK